jgi:hypothetical protein
MRSSFGKYSRAIARLMIATGGVDGPSASVKDRPRMTVAPSVWKLRGADVALRHLLVLAVPRPPEHAEPRGVPPPLDGQRAREADRRHTRKAADPGHDLACQQRACLDACQPDADSITQEDALVLR